MKIPRVLIVDFVICCFRGGREYANFFPKKIAFTSQTHHIRDYMNGWYTEGREQFLTGDGRQIKMIGSEGDVESLHQQNFLTVAVKDQHLADVCTLHAMEHNRSDNKDGRYKTSYLLSNLIMHRELKPDKHITIHGNDITITNQSEHYFPYAFNRKVVQSVTYHNLSEHDYKLYQQFLNPPSSAQYEKNWKDMIDIASKYKMTIKLV